MEQTIEYIKKLSATREKLAKDPRRPEPSWVRITTITMGSKFKQEIDLAKFHENFVKLGSVRIRPVGSTGPGFEWTDRKSTRLNSSHVSESRMPSSA